MLWRRAVVSTLPFATFVRCAMSSCGPIPTITLNDGYQHPAIGYGTYKVGVVPASASSAVASGSTATEAVDPSECVATALKLVRRGD